MQLPPCSTQTKETSGLSQCGLPETHVNTELQPLKVGGGEESCGSKHWGEKYPVGATGQSTKAYCRRLTRREMSTSDSSKNCRTNWLGGWTEDYRHPRCLKWRLCGTQWRGPGMELEEYRQLDQKKTMYFFHSKSCITIWCSLLLSVLKKFPCGFVCLRSMLCRSPPPFLITLRSSFDLVAEQWVCPFRGTKWLTMGFTVWLMATLFGQKVVFVEWNINTELNFELV